MASRVSPFLTPGSVAFADSLAIVHLRRDQQVPTILKERDEDDEGYKEGKVVNTRFGSFPHNTLIGVPWGTQVRASKVDTGSRGRRDKGAEKKRKREDAEAENAGQDSAAREAVTASSGFIHLLPPTPENWTSSLPHRTQVVYTPDYSYILHRIRARPGSTIIEAGAGSGSFTHASARAVYNGYLARPPSKKVKTGKVWSYEFHEQRHSKLVKEIDDHGLDGVVEITHRDVCTDGFLVGPGKDESPNAEAIFLDLPAPWLALPHLARRTTSEKGGTSVSPLNPRTTVHICTFSPCIEQVQRTISAMRSLGWVDISMVEVSQKRLEIRRERVGIQHQAEHGVQSSPASVEEAVGRLLDIEDRFRSFHGSQSNGEPHKAKKPKQNPNSKKAIIESLIDRKIYKEGNLVHRTEPEIKTHTSYLVFAVLPREWSLDDEEKARAKWPLKVWDSSSKEEPVIGVSRRQMKKNAREAQKSAEGSRDEQVAEDSMDIDAVGAE